MTVAPQGEQNPAYSLESLLYRGPLFCETSFFLFKNTQFQQIGGRQKELLYFCPIFKFSQPTMENNKFTIRPAKPNEAGLVLEFINKLAVYEKCADEVVADETTLYHSLFVEKSAEVVFAEEDGVVIGFALFFHNFSTFVGRKGLYLEDLFIIPEKRGLGYGKALLNHLAKIAVERHCGRMEWICLDWNKPALKVYRSIGAIPMDEWTVQRLDEEALKKFAGQL